MTNNPPEGPEIQWSDPDKVVRYDAVFALQWPVFPVKLSRDPEEILAARNETFRYAQDPRGVNELKLLPGGDTPATPPHPDDLLIGPGYLIPTSTEPTRVYDVFAERPRVLDAVHSLDFRRGSPWPEQVKEFVEKFGFPGSTLQPWTMSPRGWRCGALSANVRETRSTQRIRVGRRQRKRTCWDCEREWKRMVVPLEPGRPSEARQLLRTRR